MDEIRRIVAALKKNTGAVPVRIPRSWDIFGFAPDGNGRELTVDPAAFFAYAIEKGVLEQARKPLKADVDTVYSMLVRMFTAYDYHEKDRVEPGTFLRALALLPLLERMGVDTVYLLPVFAHSRAHNKGEWGSPYAIKDFFALDPELHDPLLGAYTREDAARQFRAFVQGCHARGMRVMLDFVFRTCARDNELIRSHPDWFYWVDAKDVGDFRAPYIEGHPPGVPLDTKAAERVYASPGTAAYIKRFRRDPRAQDAALFDTVRAQEEDVLAAVEARMGLTTAPAFSDVINDPQPPWTDVTYLRFDFAPTCAAEAHGFGDAPPFVLHDAIKLNIFPAREPNVELTDMVQGLIPYYIGEYGIDGARVDMGHALEPWLNRAIVARARDIKPGFVFWSEQLGMDGADTAKAEGFDFISGDVWGRFARVNERRFGLHLTRGLHACALPYMAAMELPDTPRAALLAAGERQMKACTLLFALLPGSVFLINSGQEVMERQPMNLGLGESAAGRFALTPGDPMQGKLAFFDPYRLHWDGLDVGLSALELARALRQEAGDLLRAPGAAVPMRRPGVPWTAGALYRSGGRCLVAVVNTGARKTIALRMKDVFRPGALKAYARVRPTRTLGGPVRRAGRLLRLRPGEMAAGWVDMD